MLPKSSLRMVPVAVAVPSVAPSGPDSMTLKAPSSSIAVSPTTFSVITLLVSPAANVTSPLVSPLKSVSAVVPWTSDQLTDDTPSPLSRVTVKVNAVVPDKPSAWPALVAAMLITGGMAAAPTAPVARIAAGRSTVARGREIGEVGRMVMWISGTGRETSGCSLNLYSDFLFEGALVQLQTPPPANRGVPWPPAAVQGDAGQSAPCSRI